MKKITESSEQMVLIERCSHHPILSKYLIAIPNGGQRNPITGARLKKEGVKKGVSDLFLAYPMRFQSCDILSAGLWIELKKPQNCKPAPITKEQLDWIKMMGDVGYETHICYGQDEAWECLVDYLGE
ncbi:MAG TPA: VRR-NUC domain-containing protein [Candidatus Sulfotelmatobacter sp.]|jgi:hypothetical protein|nr:VRR-NUC domain-containing protein [Candidatus Sulfotelmatobacter sp.]